MKHSKYAIEGGKVSKSGKFCPRCGMGVFLANHKDRVHCGRCGYTEFKQGVPRIKEQPKPKQQPKKEQKPKEQPKQQKPKEVKKEEAKKEETNKKGKKKK